MIFRVILFALATAAVIGGLAYWLKCLCLCDYNAEHELCFILTSKESREFYFLYELVDGEFKKLGKARTPKELEDKFEVSKRMRCAQ